MEFPETLGAEVIDAFLAGRNAHTRHNTLASLNGILYTYKVPLACWREDHEAIEIAIIQPRTQTSNRHRRILLEAIAKHDPIVPIIATKKIAVD